VSRVNRTPLTDEQRALAGDPKHVGYARARSAPWRRKYPWLADDIESAALEGLVKAARNYDPGRGLDFNTILGPNVDGRILDLLREYHQLLGWRRKARADAPQVERLFTERWAHWLGLPDEPATDEMPVGWTLDDGVDELTKGLPAPHKRAVRAYFTRAGATNLSVAREMGLSESRVSQIISRSLSMLREKFRTEEAAV
jgi:RNA polymerase sigma factor (sigma-70 family)